jgi:hypothetical protein
MGNVTTGRCGLLLAIVALAAAPAAAKDKQERALVGLPVIVEAPTDAAPRTYSFRTGQFWGAQPAHYRSAVTVAASVPVPEIGPDAGIAAGEPLVELAAVADDWKGSLYCKARRGEKKNFPPSLLCVADRNGDGAMDQLWVGVAASLDYVVPYPDIRALRPIEPVAAQPVTDPAILGLRIGFYVSGTNPLLGQHHFYSMISRSDALGYVLIETHKAAAMHDLPKDFRVGFGRVRVTSFVKGQYQAEAIGYPTGEMMIVSPYPTRTIFISVPG